MKVPYYHVDAFTCRLFGGNPAGVCLLERWPADWVLQSIAAENNLSETAFLVPQQTGFHLRWFTPTVEVDLCGHATLAAAYVLFFERGYRGDTIEFASASGVLKAIRREALLELDFPARPPVPWPEPKPLAEALGRTPASVHKARDFLAVFETQEDVLTLQPDQSRLSQLDAFGIIVTAPGQDCDFVSRFFAPRAGVPEDPVTGSAHCTLIPFWAERLGKTKLLARQVSRRGGELHCRLDGSRVAIAGAAVVYSRASLEVPG
jgi:PhzF family phenazine biosynthesis protein